MDFEIIDDSQVVAVKRGRKAKVDEKLVTALKTLPKGKGIAVTGLRCDPKAENYKSAKATAGAQIRSAAKAAGVKVSVAWSPDGLPQATVIGKA